MSDAVILELIKTVATLATVVIGGIITIRMGKLQRSINGHYAEMQSIQKQLGHAEGKIEEKEKHINVEVPVIVPTLPTGTTNLKIVEGEIKVKTDPKKK